jgi:phosphotriesterase-related protein
MVAGMAQTVLGPVVAGDLGLVLPHEHLFVRIEGWAIPARTPEEERLAGLPMSFELLPWVLRRALSSKDNCRVEDPEVVLEEVGRFVAAGGRTIVDLTLPALGRDPALVWRVSREADVQVILGCGYYVHDAHPPELEDMSVEAIAEELERELLQGIDGTDVRAGVIGELGTGSPVTPREAKVLRAGALAHRRTGAPISIHLFPAGGTARTVLDILEEAGADPGKVVLGHLDGQDPIRVEEHVALASRGAYVEYDVFGANWSSDDTRELYADRLYWSPPPSDQQRVRAISQLFDAGMGDRVLISHDICTKIQQRAWGGYGFAHIPDVMRPFFAANGLDQEAFDQIVRSNPQRWVAWGDPAE